MSIFDRSQRLMTDGVLLAAPLCCVTFVIAGELPLHADAMRPRLGHAMRKSPWAAPPLSPHLGEQTRAAKACAGSKRSKQSSLSHTSDWITVPREATVQKATVAEAGE
ncbi:hypothetical protein [Rubrimonas cliftonensis]|uniref:hypothetical protein n=1 Tax=Rubrimonas cliftonensis TaxID=89524 RepID=UPI00158789D9|nr:hypothetical protein [Rubrimonas cliftonensis]